MVSKKIQGKEADCMIIGHFSCFYVYKRTLEFCKIATMEKEIRRHYHFAEKCAERYKNGEKNKKTETCPYS